MKNQQPRPPILKAAGNIAHQAGVPACCPSNSDHGLWFRNNHVRIRSPASAGADGISILEFTVPFGDSPPLHLHVNEDENFYVLEGAILFSVEDRTSSNGRPAATANAGQLTSQPQHPAMPAAFTTRIRKAGDCVCIAKGTLHSYKVLSESGARYLTIMRGSEFESFVREMSTPALHEGLPTSEEELEAGMRTGERSGGTWAAKHPSAYSQRLVDCGRAHGVEVRGPPL